MLIVSRFLQGMAGGAMLICHRWPCFRISFHDGRERAHGLQRMGNRLRYRSGLRPDHRRRDRRGVELASGSSWSTSLIAIGTLMLAWRGVRGIARPAGRHAGHPRHRHAVARGVWPDLVHHARAGASGLPAAAVVASLAGNGDRLHPVHHRGEDRAASDVRFLGVPDPRFLRRAARLDGHELQLLAVHDLSAGLFPERSRLRRRHRGAVAAGLYAADAGDSAVGRASHAALSAAASSFPQACSRSAWASS